MKGNYKIIAIALMAVALATPSMALTSSDVSVTLNNPEQDEVVEVTNLFNTDVRHDYTVENTNSANETSGDVNLTVSDSSGTSDELVINENISVGTSTATDYSYNYEPSDALNYGEDWTSTVEYTDTTESFTVTDSVTYEAVQSDVFGAIVQLFVLMAVIGMVARLEL